MTTTSAKSSNSRWKAAGRCEFARAAWSFGTTDSRILTRSNAQLRARSRVIERATAREITSGNTIVVPNHAFVQEARAVLPVRILAQTRVQVYHSAVEAALPGIPGASRSAKVRHVIERLRSAGARTVVEATVLDWLNVSEHQLLPPEQRRPHAPQHWREFRAFM